MPHYPPGQGSPKDIEAIARILARKDVAPPP
jgi:hypothetical protein